MKLWMSGAALILILTSCAHLNRSPESGYSSDSGTTSSSDRYLDQSARKTAYEMGKDPAQLSASDYDDIRSRQNLKQLEKSLSSKKEREQYSKILPWLQNDRERTAFLSIPSIEGRQQWINKNNIWSRSQAPVAEMKELVETQDIAVGMPQDYVRKSWGDPLAVEVSGNPIYKNERWKFQRQISTSQGFRKETRFVYFEGGRVVGWETE